MSSGIPANACDRMDLPLGEEPLRDAALIEHLDRAGVQTAGARAVEVLAGAPFDDDDVDARQRQLARQHQPRRTAAGDHHRMRHAHYGKDCAHSTPRRCAARLPQRPPRKAERLGCEGLRGFLRDEMTAGSGRPANVAGPSAPDLGGVGQLRLLGARDDENRAVDAPAQPPVVSVMLAIEPVAGAIVAADCGRRRARRPEVGGEGVIRRSRSDRLSTNRR